VIQPPVYLSGYEGWDTTITCNIFGYPTPRVEWTRALQALPQGRHVMTGNHLIIKKTRKEDKGPYMCKGFNDHGNVFALIVLTVYSVRKYYSNFLFLNMTYVFNQIQSSCIAYCPVPEGGKRRRVKTYLSVFLSNMP